MVESIFKTAGPLDFDQDQAVYVERSEMQAIFHEIQRPEIDSYLALLGSRQTGKTTLLYRIYRVLKQIDEPVVFLDLSSYRLESAAQSYAHAAGKIWEELKTSLTTAKKLRVIASAVDGPIRFREFLLDLAQHCPSRRIVILLDEVGAFMSNIGFFETIRSIASSRGFDSEQAFQKYLFIFSGAVDLHDLTTSRNSPLANVCTPLYLQDFSFDNTVHLVKNLSQVSQLEKGVAEYIYEQTLGHPYLTQRVCSLLEQICPPQITVQTAEQVIDQIQEEDENLRYVTLQLERYAEASKLLQKLLLENMVLPFSMINPHIARLFIIGALRKETTTEKVDGIPRERALCAVRNPIYRRSLTNYYEMWAPFALPAAYESATHDNLVDETIPQAGESQQEAFDQPASLQAPEQMNKRSPLPPAVDARNYLDFGLHIYPSPTRGAPFPITVDSWAGTGRGQLLFDVRSLSLGALLKRMEQNQIEPNDVYSLGGMLWQAIFSSAGIERRYVACQAEAGTQKGIRIKLTIESPDLMNLPWEYLYDPESQTFPALSPRTPITRYTNPRQQDPPPLAFDPPLRILLVSASPEEQPKLDVEAEREQIIQAMELLEATGKVEIETLTNATVRTLQVMLRRPFHVLHYIGHGTYDEQTNSGMLALEHKDGSQHAVSAAQLQYLLRDTTVRLAVFNACMTARGAAGRSIAGELMRAGISATLAMQFAISETSARIFAGEFYRTLADGWPVDAAAAEGRKAVMFATDLTNMDWGIPVLFMRTRDGVLFHHEHKTNI